MTNLQDNSPSTSIYAIFDSVSGTNVQYFDSCNDETAIRLVQQNATNPNSFLYKQKEDLALYRLFKYNPKDGDSVLCRELIYSLSALPNLPDKPFGLDAVEIQLNELIKVVADLKSLDALNKKLEVDNIRLKKQANVSFIDKLFKGKDDN